MFPLALQFPLSESEGLEAGVPRLGCECCLRGVRANLQEAAARRGGA